MIATDEQKAALQELVDDAQALGIYTLGPDEARCSECQEVKPHTIRRIDHQGAPVLCNGCHNEKHRRNGE